MVASVAPRILRFVFALSYTKTIGKFFPKFKQCSDKDSEACDAFKLLQINF